MSSDPVKVASHAYKVLLENEQVRVLDVRLQPGDRTALHSHPKNIVCVLAESVIKFTALGVKERIVRNKAGSAIWVEAGSHSTENVGNTESHNIVVELKG